MELMKSMLKTELSQSHRSIIKLSIYS